MRGSWVATVVSCISSSCFAAWTPLGVDLLEPAVVDTAGIVSGVVASAMCRLSQECSVVQIKYDYAVRQKGLQQLKDWFEWRLDFGTVKTTTGELKNTTCLTCRR